MKAYRWMVPALLAAAALGAPRRGEASDTPVQSQSAEDADKTRSYLSTGNKAFKAGKFAEAEAAYAQAFALKKVHDIAGNLAMAEFAQGKMRAAAEHLAFALRLFPVTGEPAQRDAMQKTFDQCKGSVGAVKVSVSVQGAQVFVDGKAVGEAPLLDPVFVEPGEHTVEAKKPEEYKDASNKVTTEKGGTVQVTLTMEALPKPKVGKEVTIEVPGPRRNVVPGVIMGVVALGAIGAGAGLFVVSEGKRADAFSRVDDIAKRKGSCVIPPIDSSCNGAVNLARQSDTLHNIAVGAFIGGGVLAVGTLTYLLLPPPKVKKKVFQSGGLQVTPIVGTREGGMVVSSGF